MKSDSTTEKTHPAAKLIPILFPFDFYFRLSKVPQKYFIFVGFLFEKIITQLHAC
jgi:hypothetical protein